MSPGSSATSLRFRVRASGPKSPATARALSRSRSAFTAIVEASRQVVVHPQPSGLGTPAACAQATTILLANAGERGAEIDQPWKMSEAAFPVPLDLHHPLPYPPC